jgi:hypothetical protein
MYAYYPDAGKWEVIRDMKGVGVETICYAAEEDCYYGLRLDLSGEEPPVIHQFNSVGAVARTVNLSEPAPLPSFRPGRAPNQLVAAGRQLVLLTTPLPDLTHPDVPEVVRCYLLDPRSGKVAYSGVSEPQAAAEKLAAGDLEALWRELAGGDPVKADLAMWRMAAGAKEAVDFLRGKLKQPARPDLGRVRTLIGQLEDAQFRVRDKAFAELKALGPAAESELQQALVKAASAETRRRLEGLLRLTEQAEAADPEARREQRAVTVLARVGTPEAVRYLSEIASWPGGTFQSRQARQALQHLGRR